jgi:hypothetical protein
MAWFSHRSVTRLVLRVSLVFVVIHGDAGGKGGVDAFDTMAEPH